jgi:L-asparaginase II
MHAIPIIRAFRGDLCENAHFASTVVCSQTGNVHQMFPKSADHRVFLRSAAKPFQAYPLYQNPQANTISLEEWAIICASHAASQHHLDLVYRVLERGQATPEDLQCGPHLPMDDAMVKQLLCNHESPTRIHNNCSGKHAGMLLACRYYGWPIETHLEPSHPLQQAILKTIETYSGTTDIDTAIDGCGAPVFGLPMKNIARLYSNFVSQPEFSTLVDAMTRYPEVVGDAQRIDTRLMKISQGNLVAKVGAEGFLGVGNRQTGEGLALKVHDGTNAIRDRIIIAILEDLAWLSAAQAEILWQDSAFTKNRTNTQGKVVGHFEITLPWEKPTASAEGYHTPVENP